MAKRRFLVFGGSEVIEAVVKGERFRKRVRRGERWLLISWPLDGRPFATAHRSQAEAEGIRDAAENASTIAVRGQTYAGHVVAAGYVVTNSL